MQTLPPLVLDAVAWRLPITERSVTALCDAVMCGDREPLEAALACDPTLVLWTVCQAAQVDNTSLTRLSEVANWLAGGPLGTWLARHDVADVVRVTESWDANPVDRQRWSDLVAESVLVAELASALAQRQRVDAEEAYLVGLLHKAPVWFDMDGSAPRQPREVLPTWLLDRLPQTFRGQTAWEPPVVRCVEEVTTWLIGQQRPPADIPFDRRDLDDRREQVASEWFEPWGTAVCWWPELVARQQRLEQLSTLFSATLQQEKLAALAEFAAGAGHEINNPLANISGRAQLLAREEPHPERQRDLVTIHHQAQRVHEMIADLMLFARPPDPHWETLELSALLDDVLAQLLPSNGIPRAPCRRFGPRETLWVQGDRAQLQAALRAICENGQQAAGRNGEVRVNLRSLVRELASAATPLYGSSDHESQHWCELEIRDTGPGLSTEARRHLFDPFYSGRQAGRGLGLGLSKAWRIVTGHGGELTVDSDGGQGTLVRLRLPQRPTPVSEAGE